MNLVMPALNILLRQPVCCIRRASQDAVFHKIPTYSEGHALIFPWVWTCEIFFQTIPQFLTWVRSYSAVTWSSVFIVSYAL